MRIRAFLARRRAAGFPLIRRAGAALFSPGGTVPGPTPDSEPIEQPKGWLRSKTIVATIAGFVYTVGVTRGWWDIPQEDFLALAVPIITMVGAIWGRITAKKRVAGALR